MLARTRDIGVLNCALQSKKVFGMPTVAPKWRIIAKRDLWEAVKYYFADFVSKGVPPPPFADKSFAEKDKYKCTVKLDTS